MKEYFLGNSIALTVPSGATNLLVVHEWSNIVSDFIAAPTSFIPDSIGVYSLYWVNTVATITSSDVVPINTSKVAVTGNTVKTVTTTTTGTVVKTATIVSKDIFTVDSQFVSSTDFFADYAGLNTTANSNRFAMVERQARLLIERLTQQKFGPYLNKTLLIQGEGYNDLPVPYPIYNIRQIVNNYGDDMTDKCSISTISPWFIHHDPDVLWLDTSVDIGYIDRKKDVTYRSRKEFFSNRMNFAVTGDWGYEYVPQDITEAAKLIINDTYTGDQDLRRAGIDQAQLGDYSYRLTRGDWGTTGNMIADELLSPYVMINLGLV